MTTARTDARVLTVGAFERDNFGDVLFLLLTRGYLAEAGADAVAASTMTTMIPGREGGVARSAGALLARDRWDAVWVVGGEIGGVRVDSAYGMSMSTADRQAFARARPVVQNLVSRFISGTDTAALAYLPDLATFPLNAEVPLLVNSVGISNLGHGLDDHAAVRSDRILRSARRVQVREEQSKTYADAHGLAVDLGPDMVHAISLREGFQLDQVERPTPRPYVLVQLNTETIRRHDLKELAASVADLSRRLDLDVGLFAAGIAHAHDSRGLYDAIAEMTRRTHGTERVFVIRDRDARALAGWVAHADLWIGTSLHGRIISSSYGIPRVTLQNDKVARYAATWDPGFAAGVSPLEWDAAVDAALGADPARAREQSDRLARTADDNTKRLVGEIR